MLCETLVMCLITVGYFEVCVQSIVHNTVEMSDLIFVFFLVSLEKGWLLLISGFIFSNKIEVCIL